ncbi:MAG: hypothetical protein ACREF3_13145 [Acetobacteraceae bacterium]
MSHTAQIIRFPIGASNGRKPDQLDAALDTLSGALIAQQAAIKAWRGVLGELQSSMAGLGDSVSGYRARLMVLNQRVSELRAEAAKLGRWADSAAGAD